jgi:hypothetical protein
MFPIILGGAALLITLLDKLTSFSNQSEQTIKETQGLIQSSLIPLVALIGGGLLLYETLKRGKRK